MAEWESRADIRGDVVYFNYADEEQQRLSEEVFIWDLDKTYLDTSFHSFRDLLNTAMEKAFQKRNIPGTWSLVRALKNSHFGLETGARDTRAFPIYFITASPPLMEQKIREKLQLDGIAPYGAFFKDNLKNLRPKRLWRLTQQVGYKVQALLQLRVRLPENVRQVMWGDDSESDAIIYSLYSDICARRHSPTELRQLLRSLRVIGDQVDVIMDLQGQIPEHDPVEKVYINLAVDTDPEYYLKFGRRVVPTTSTLQVSLDLYQDGRLRDEQVIRVAQDMVINFGFTTDELESELDDLIRRQVLGLEAYEKILQVLQENELISEHFKPSITPAPVDIRSGERVFQLEGVTEPWVPERIDYLRDSR